MRPAYVQTLEDYWVWLEHIITASGGWLEHEILTVRPLGHEPHTEPQDWAGLYLDHHQLSFGDGSSLWFSFVVDTDLALTEYSFHYQDEVKRLIWRKCNRPGHEREAGLLHIHWPEGEEEDRVEPYDEVDLEDALRQVYELRR